MASCSHWFYAEDQDGNYPSVIDPEFVLKNFLTGVVIGNYTIPNTGRKLTLDNSIRYTAIPLLSVSDEANWVRPSDVNFYGCVKDTKFVWKKKICTPGAKKCIGDDVYKCSGDGTEWKFSENCPGGCLNGECVAPATCTQEYRAEDGSGNAMPGTVYADFQSWNGSSWVSIGTIEIPSGGVASNILSVGDRHRLGPMPKSGYITPTEIEFTACTTEVISLVYTTEDPVISSISWSPKGSFHGVAAGASLVGRHGSEFRVIAVGPNAAYALAVEEIIAELAGATAAVYKRGDTFMLDGEGFTILHAISDWECDQAVIAKNISTNQHPTVGEEIQFSANINWNDDGATTTTRQMEWFYLKPPSESYTKAYADDINNWTHFATDTLPAHTFTAIDDADIIYLKVIAQNKANQTTEFGFGNCSAGLFNLWSGADGFEITVVDAAGTDKLSIAEAVLIPGINAWTVLPILLPFGVGVLQWINVTERTYFGTSNSVDLCVQSDPHPDHCDLILEVGKHYAVFRSTMGISVIDGKYVHELKSGRNSLTVDRTLLSALETTVCGLLGISGTDCTSFIAEFNDVVFVGNYYSLQKDGVDMFGNVRELTWFDHMALPFALAATVVPLPFGKFVSEGLEGFWKGGKHFSDGAFTWMETVAIAPPGEKIVAKGPWSFMQSIVRISGDHLDEVMELAHADDFTTAAAKLEEYLASDLGNTPYRVYTDFNDALRKYLPLEEWEALMDTIYGIAPQADSILKTASKTSPTADDIVDIAHAAGQSGVMDEATSAMYNSLRKADISTTKELELANVLKNSPEIGKELIKTYKIVIDDALLGKVLEKEDILAIANHGEFAPKDMIDMIMSYTPAKREEIITAFDVDDYQSALSNLFYKMDDAYELVLARMGPSNTESWVRGLCDTAKSTLSTTFKEGDVPLSAHKVARNQAKLVEDYCGGHYEPCFTETSDALFGAGKTAADEIVAATDEFVDVSTGSWYTKGKAYTTARYNTAWNWFSNLSKADSEKAVGAMVVAALFFAATVLYAIYQLSDTDNVSPLYNLRETKMEESYWVCENAADEGLFDGLAAALVIFRKDVTESEKWIEDNKAELEGEETYEEFRRSVELRRIQIGIFEARMDELGPTGVINCTSNATFFYVDLDGKAAGFAYNTQMIQLKGIPIGSHTVKIYKHGYIPESCAKSIKVTDGVTEWFDCQMTKIGDCSLVSSIIISLIPKTPIKGETVAFTGYATSDDPIETWEWDFGDGSPKVTGQAVTHTYTKVGIFKTTLTVTNDCGNFDSAERMITVLDPTIEESGTLLVKEPIDSVTSEKCAGSWTAEIYVDGNTIGKTTQFSIPFGTNSYIGGYGGPCGDHVIKVVLSGYDDAVKSVTINDDDSKSWQPVMSLHGTAVGTVKLTSNQTGFAGYVDGKFVGNSGTNDYLNVQNVVVGSRTVKIVKGMGYTPEFCEGTVTVTDGGTAIYDCQMSEITLPEHTISVEVPVGSILWADGNVVT